MIVGEAAKGLGIIAKGKGEDKASHLNAKVSQTCLAHIHSLIVAAAVGSENVELRATQAIRRRCRCKR